MSAACCAAWGRRSCCSSARRTASIGARGAASLLGERRGALAALVDTLARPGGAKTLVAVNNWFAAAALNAAKERGLAAPRDFELIAFDNNPEFLDCHLTTMAHPFREFGEVFGRWIAERSWLDAYPGKVTVKVRSRLIVRNTLPVPERFLLP